jgi:Ca-activated chloride channel family protein
MKKIIFIRWFLFLLLLSPIPYPLSAAHGSSQTQLKEGNRQFKKGNYEKALDLYQDGLIDAPYSSILHYNAGDATMMKGDFPKAEVSFTEAAKSSDPVLRGASHYNRGNALYYQEKWADAAEAYKDSLRANPRDEDAKYNLTVAMKAMKNPPPKKSGSQGSQSKKDDSKKGNDKKDAQAQQSQPKPGQMSKEDAERLLAAAAASEKKKGNQQAGQPGAGKNDEDW